MPYFNLVVCYFDVNCMSSLHIFDINVLTKILFANILSRSVGCLFVLMIVSFAVQKLFLCLFLLVSLS